MDSPLSNRDMVARCATELLKSASAELLRGIDRLGELGLSVEDCVAIVSDVDGGRTGMVRFVPRQALAEGGLPEAFVRALAAPRRASMPVLVIFRDHDEATLAWASIDGLGDPLLPEMTTPTA